ncbi:MAG: acyltransferase domain-containing protein [Lachnospiraceae bacterium]|nr:acyltransferase domain-containing protein [Lachnospiraceae bacterium]
MIAYLFPGQGSQKEGMYNLIKENEADVSEVFDEASKVTGRDIRALCRDATEEELKQTLNTQISVTTMNMAYAKLLEKRGIKPDVVAGHSLGQLSAIAAAGVISTVDLFRLVKKR